MPAILFFLILVLSSAVFSQDVGMPENGNHQGYLKTEKIDEFGPLAECDRGARLDAFASQLQQQPSAKGYIIYYQGEDDLPTNIENSERIGKMYLEYLTLNRGIPSSRVELMSSYRKQTITELWLVPENAEPPKPTETISKPKIPTDKTLLFDSTSVDFLFGSDSYVDVLLPSKKAEYEKQSGIYNTDFKEISSENMPDGLNLSAEEIENLKFNWTSDRFGTFLGKNEKLKGVILFYADDQEYDINKLTNHIEEGKQRIAKTAKIEPQKIQVIFGGYKSYIEIEFWTVPEKGVAPIPKPEERVIETETENEDQ